MSKKFYLNASFSANNVEKRAGKSTLKIAGYANTVDKDRSGDVVLPSAWAQGIDSYRKNPVLLYQHKHDNPIGRVEKITVDKKGIYIEAAVSEAAEKLHGVHSLIKDGALKSFSVGFMVKDGKLDKAKDTFVISEVELLEISVVSVPANQESLFSVKKSFENDSDYEEFKKQFDVEEKQQIITVEEVPDISIGITTMTDNHFHAYQVDEEGNGKTIFTSATDDHIHTIMAGQVQASEDHVHKLTDKLMGHNSEEEDEEEEDEEESMELSVKTVEETEEEIVETRDPYEPIPFINLLSADTAHIKNGQFVQLDGDRYQTTKIATSESPTFQFKQVDLQGLPLDKILNIDATTLEVVNIKDIDSKFDLILARIEDTELDEGSKQSIQEQYKHLVNASEQELYKVKASQELTELEQEKLNRTINLVTTKTWTDSEYKLAKRVCQVIEKLKEIEQVKPRHNFYRFTVI